MERVCHQHCFLCDTVQGHQHHQVSKGTLAGHIVRVETSLTHSTVTWKPPHGDIKKRQAKTTFVDTVLRDTGIENIKQLESCMKDRDI